MSGRDDKPRLSYAAQANAPFKRRLIRGVEMASGCLHLERLYLDNRRAPKPGESFWSACIRRLRLDVAFDHAALARAPRAGPLVVIANHPYGVLDGLTICYLAERLRPDFMILASAVLEEVPEIRPHLLPVDLSSRPQARQTNVATRRHALAHLRRGGAVVIFPAGLISTAPDRWGRQQAVDPPWRNFTAQLVRRAQADVLPVFFHGQNGRLFQMVSHVSRAMRLALIFHEVQARIGTRVAVTIGAPLPYRELAGNAGDKALTQALRARTYALGATPPRDED